MDSEIPVTEARARFSELVNRVGFGHERITLTRHGRPLVTLVPADAPAEADDPPVTPAGPTVLDLSSRSTATTRADYSPAARSPSS